MKNPFNPINRFIQLEKRVIIEKGCAVGPSEGFREHKIIRDVLTDNHERLFCMIQLNRKHFS